MIFVGVDTETHLTGAARQAPALVCLSYDYGADSRSGVCTARESIAYATQMLQNSEITLVLHNAAYDLPVLIEAANTYYGAAAGLEMARLVFKAYATGRIVCTLLRQKLADLARGMLQPTGAKADLPSERHLPHEKKSGVYTLAGCMWRHFGIDRGADKAEDAVRYKYYEVEGLPVEQWPADFYRYALQDSTDALHLFRRQEERYASNGGVFDCQAARARADFTLRLVDIWGLRTNPVEVERLHDHCTAIRLDIEERLLAAGLMREKWVKGELHYSVNKAEQQRWIKAAYESKGHEVPHTKESKTHPKTPQNPRGGQVKTDSDTIQGILSIYDDDDAGKYQLLIDMANASLAGDLLSKYIPALREGTLYPLHGYFNSLLRTGRTSSNKYRQTPPRESLACFGCGLKARKIPSGAESCPKCGSYIGDVRRCYEARKGYVYCSVDYDQLELCTLGQACVDLTGGSTIADAINAGLDLHCVLGVELMGGGITYEEFKRRKGEKDPVVVNWRQWAKGGNFGLPGKLGVGGLVRYMRGYGVYLTDTQGQKLKSAWSRKWHDMAAYFHAINSMGFAGFGSTATIKHPRTGLIRGGCELPAACNFMFQGLAAEGMLDAAFHVAQEMYTDPHSPLWGSRLCNELHDELISELVETRAPEAGDRQAQIMRERMQLWTPNVAIRGAQPALMRKWYKGADTVRDAQGTLQIWRPR